MKRRCGEEVERPIRFKRMVCFTTESRSRELLKQIDWYSVLLERYLEAGYKAEVLFNLFRAIPTDLADVIKLGLRSLVMLKTAQTPPPGAGVEIPPAFTRSFDEHALMEDR